MKKFFGFLAILCVFHVIVGGALLGYLFLTGRLDGEKMQVIADLAKLKGTPENLREKVGEILDPPAVEVVATTQKSDDEELTGVDASADERLAFTRQAMEQERIQQDRRAQNMLDQQRLLEDQKRLLEERIAKFEAEKKAFEPKAADADDKVCAENFAKMLALYDELKPRQVKDLMYKAKDVELTAAFLAAMDSSRAAKIIAEFKSDEEQTWIGTVLERIRLAGTHSASGLRMGGDVAALPK